MSTPSVPVGERPVAKRNVLALGLLCTFGPISLDLCLPALPELADDLQASTSAAQLSITACLIGLALGQLVAGPLSDRFGRRRPLIVGLVAYLLVSLACAFDPSITVLLVLRLVQGLAGPAGLVIAGRRPGSLRGPHPGDFLLPADPDLRVRPGDRPGVRWSAEQDHELAGDLRGAGPGSGCCY